MGYNDRNSQGRQSNRNASRPPRQVTARPLPANYVDEAERVIRSLYDEQNKISTNKIRNLLSLVSEIYNRENLRTADTISEESASGLIALRIRMVYEAGRDDAVKLFLERAQLLEYIKGLGDSRAKLMDFAHYMEALVGLQQGGRYSGAGISEHPAFCPRQQRKNAPGRREQPSAGCACFRQ